MVTFSLEPSLILPASHPLLHTIQMGPLAENTRALGCYISIVGLFFCNPAQNQHFEDKDSASVTFASSVPGS